MKSKFKKISLRNKQIKTSLLIVFSLLALLLMRDFFSAIIVFLVMLASYVVQIKFLPHTKDMFMQYKISGIQKNSNSLASFSMLIMIVWALIVLITGNHGEKAVALLISFCPGVLTLGIPAFFLSTIINLKKHEINIDSEEQIVSMSKIKMVVFSKTGTLTKGKMHVTSCRSLSDEIDAEAILTIAASTEINESTPISSAIVAYAKEHNTKLYKTSNFVQSPGLGISATLFDTTFYCGSKKYLDDMRINIFDKARKAITTLTNQGELHILVGDTTKCIGILTLKDEIRKTARACVSKLHSVHLSTTIVSNGNKHITKSIADEVGIKKTQSELTPAEMESFVLKQIQQKKPVLAVGCKKSDIPLLVAATVSIIMTKTITAFNDVGSIFIKSTDLNLIHMLYTYSKKTMSVMKLTVLGSMLINVVCITLTLANLLNPIGASILYLGNVMLFVFVNRWFRKKNLFGQGV